MTVPYSCSAQRPFFIRYIEIPSWLIDLMPASSNSNVFLKKNTRNDAV